MVKNIIPKLGWFVFLSVTVFPPQKSRTMDFLQSLPSLSSCFFLNVCVCSPPPATPRSVSGRTGHQPSPAADGTI